LPLEPARALGVVDKLNFREGGKYCLRAGRNGVARYFGQLCGKLAVDHIAQAFVWDIGRAVWPHTKFKLFALGRPNCLGDMQEHLAHVGLPFFHKILRLALARLPYGISPIGRRADHARLPGFAAKAKQGANWRFIGA
jgi:hypothetical protein